MGRDHGDDGHDGNSDQDDGVEDLVHGGGLEQLRLDLIDKN